MIERGIFTLFEVLILCFDRLDRMSVRFVCARPQPCSIKKNVFILCSTKKMFWPEQNMFILCSTVLLPSKSCFKVSSVHEKKLHRYWTILPFASVLQFCEQKKIRLKKLFSICLLQVSTVLEICFNRARGRFRMCSRYVSTVLDVCYNCSRGRFRMCSRYVTTELEVGFECARGRFRLLEVCYNCARGRFRQCSIYRGGEEYSSLNLISGVGIQNLLLRASLNILRLFSFQSQLQFAFFTQENVLKIRQIFFRFFLVIGTFCDV